MKKPDYDKRYTRSDNYGNITAKNQRGYKMKAYKTNKILAVGDTYFKGTITEIRACNGGWILTLEYKTRPTKQIFIYHN